VFEQKHRLNEKAIISSQQLVNISSTGAKVAIPLIGAYSSSKSGLEGMSDALRRELMLFGIERRDH
jgi:short-subunit dehydrogenase